MEVLHLVYLILKIFFFIKFQHISQSFKVLAFPVFPRRGIQLLYRPKAECSDDSM